MARRVAAASNAYGLLWEGQTRKLSVIPHPRQGQG